MEQSKQNKKLLKAIYYQNALSLFKALKDKDLYDAKTFKYPKVKLSKINNRVMLIKVMKYLYSLNEEFYKHNETMKVWIALFECYDLNTKSDLLSKFQIVYEDDSLIDDVAYHPHLISNNEIRDKYNVLVWKTKNYGIFDKTDETKWYVKKITLKNIIKLLGI